MRKLAVVEELVQGLHEAEIPYCHWKSNESLEAAVMGEGDLDLLVDERYASRFESLLFEQEFLRMQSPAAKTFPGLADFLGFDSETGELVHLHVHYRLVLGEQRVKNHHLPVEQQLLASTYELGGVRIPSPGAELVLLYARAHLKSGPRACARAWAGRSESPFPRGTLDELMWLAMQVEDDAVLAACQALGLRSLSDGLPDFLRCLRDERLSPMAVLRGKRSVLHQLRPYQRYNTPVAVSRKAWYRLRYSRPAQRLRPIGKKRLPEGGILVSIVGADGSGKSTLAADLPAWLGWKLRTRTVYFGQPKRSKTLVALRRAKRLTAKASDRILAAGSRRVGQHVAWLAALLNSAQWIHVARVRRRRLTAARTVTVDGGVAFAERFPVAELWDMTVPMDGPRLGANREAAGLLRRLAVLERDHYDALGVPDHEIVLKAGLTTLRARKPETPADEHAAKAEAVLALGPRPHRTILDAEHPYEDVLLRAKRAIWAVLVSRRDPNARRAAEAAALPDAVTGQSATISEA